MTPAVRIRGMREPETDAIAELIHRLLARIGDARVEADVRADVPSLTARVPRHPERLT